VSVSQLQNVADCSTVVNNG